MEKDRLILWVYIKDKKRWNKFYHQRKAENPGLDVADIFSELLDCYETRRLKVEYGRD